MDALSEFWPERLAPVRRVACISALLCLALLAACGGGGSGGGSTGSLTFTVSTTSVTATADAGTSSSPFSQFAITVTNQPPTGVNVLGNFTQNGIADVGLDATSETTATVTIRFKDPSVIGPGVFNDVVRLGLCTTTGCTTPIIGTERTVSVRYTITGTRPPPPSIAASTNFVSVQAVPFNLASLEETVTLTLQGISAENVDIHTSQTFNALHNAIAPRNASGGFDLRISFRSSAGLGFGTFTDTITVTVCSRPLCQIQVEGSPLVINVQITVMETVPGPNGYTIRQVAATADDVMWDGVSGNIYFSSPSSAPVNPNSVVALDPVAGTLGASVPAGDDPSFGAVSDDGQFLYMGFENSNRIQRFRLPGLEQDISIPLGNYESGPLYAGQILPFPGQPNSIAVSRSASPGFPGGFDAAVFDDAVQRPNAPHSNTAHVSSIQFGATPDVLYGGQNVITTMSIDADGVNFVSSATYSPVQGAGGIYFDSGLLYTDLGLVIDPVTETLVGSFDIDGHAGEFGKAAAPDSNLNRVFFLISAGFSYVVRSYDMTTFAQIAEIRLGGVEFPINRPLRMTRWGPDGLAIPTGEGTILLITGPFVRP